MSKVFSVKRITRAEREARDKQHAEYLAEHPEAHLRMNEPKAVAEFKAKHPWAITQTPMGEAIAGSVYLRACDHAEANGGEIPTLKPKGDLEKSLFKQYEARQSVIQACLQAIETSSVTDYEVEDVVEASEASSVPSIKQSSQIEAILASIAKQYQESE